MDNEQLITWVCPECGCVNHDTGETMLPMCEGCDLVDIDWQVIIGNAVKDRQTV